MVYQCGLRLAERLKSGGPSLGRNPGAHKQRRPVNQDQIESFGEIGSTQFSEQGFAPCSFFSKQANTTQRMTSPANPIHRSFELAAERCEDLTPLVYRRLFREHPEAETMFRSEGAGLVQGAMLAQTLDAIMDFAGDRSGRFRMIECEVQSHDAYGTPRKLFGAFFGVIAGTLRELLGSDWSPEIDAAWQTLLAELEGVVADTDPAITA
jgi:hemoglobin-like flavoprotein